MMLTKNTFHLIIIPDEDLDDNNNYIPGDYEVFPEIFRAPQRQSKYFGFLASALCSRCLEVLPFI